MQWRHRREPMKLNKKGVENESLTTLGKLIIGVAALLILGFGTAKLFSVTTEKNDLKNSELLTQTLEGKINAFLDSEFQETTITIQGFNEKWFITGWGENSLKRPEKCFFDTCICISEGPPTAKSCDANPQNAAKLKVDSIDVKRYVFVNRGNYYECFSYNSIPLDKKLFDLYLTKKENLLEVAYYVQESGSKLIEEKPANFDLKNCFDISSLPG